MAKKNITRFPDLTMNDTELTEKLAAHPLSDDEVSEAAGGKLPKSHPLLAGNDCPKMKFQS